MWYWKPEQPPPTTATRSATGTGLCICMISLTLVLATGVKLIIVPSRLRYPRCPIAPDCQPQYSKTQNRLHLGPFASAFLPGNSTRGLFRQASAHRLQYDAAMRHKVTLIPGEGIGPEVSAAVQRILEAAGVHIDWEEIEARADTSGGAQDRVTDPAALLNKGAIESVRRNKVALKGPMGTAVAGGAPSVNVALRKTLDLYANVRPVKNL